MEAIVVDTEQTAKECIRYLKDQMLEPETFLPLDYIQAKPLKERLRNIANPKGVKLVYDVLRYDPPDIKKAVLFVTNNCLVCETTDDAMKVAYELEDGQRYDAIGKKKYNLKKELLLQLLPCIPYYFAIFFNLFLQLLTEHFTRNLALSVEDHWIWPKKLNGGMTNRCPL